jgi:hypothetical protein
VADEEMAQRDGAAGRLDESALRPCPKGSTTDGLHIFIHTFHTFTLLDGQYILDEGQYIFVLEKWEWELFSFLVF